jgi:hypothetical protein
MSVFRSHLILGPWLILAYYVNSMTLLYPNKLVDNNDCAWQICSKQFFFGITGIWTQGLTPTRATTIWPEASGPLSGMTGTIHQALLIGCSISPQTTFLPVSVSQVAGLLWMFLRLRFQPFMPTVSGSCLSLSCVTVNINSWILWCCMVVMSGGEGCLG